MAIHNKIKNHKNIFVWADWQGLSGPMLMGILSSSIVRGQEIFSFAYDQAWLKSKMIQKIDPALELFKGVHYNASDEKLNFGVFLDSSPDRWGRLLQKRRAAIEARKSAVPEPTLFESDYLLGVYDQHRSGGLRFTLPMTEGDPKIFLNDDQNFSAPPMTSLRQLEAATWAIENQKIKMNSEYEKWIQMLILPGGSLGGARPKASVIDEKNQLWIAKFPSRLDTFNSGAWEYIVHQLAEACGIHVPEAQVKIFKGPQHTFLLKRFDRKKTHRIHFASAMTLLGKSDGASFADGSSYLEIAEFIISNGTKINSDLEQLWMRIVFNISVSNTDDHLRNHGFLLTDTGWILSPAYDMNPDPDGNGLKLNISENDNSQDFDLALSVAPYFRLTPARSEKLLKKIKSEVSKWPLLAKKLKISKSEQDQMKRAFR